MVDGATSIARRLNVSDLVIGLTIVAFGTSMPELFVNLFASAKGNTDLAIGNILGSNIANVLLILGVCAIIYPLSIESNTVWKEIPFSLLAAVIAGVLANDILIDGSPTAELNRSDGIVLIAFFTIFMIYIFIIARQGIPPTSNDYKKMSVIKSVLLILTGITGLVVGGLWIVNGAIKLAEYFGVSQSFIGLTIVAIGTSLPELASSAVAAYKKNSGIAIGNVVGSNIFNIFWVLGASALIKPLPFKEAQNTDILVTVGSSLLLFLFLFVGKRHLLQRWQGILFLIVYIIYTVYLVIRG